MGILELRIEVPVEDMGRLGQPLEIQTGPAAGAPTMASIWPAMHPRLVELIRAHRSTMIFVNSRRLAERLASAINELAEALAGMARRGAPVLVGQIDGQPAGASPLGPLLVRQGFGVTSRGYWHRGREVEAAARHA